MELSLEGRIAFVSGSTSGIGLSTARMLAEEGLAVGINGRHKKGVDDAIEQIRADASDDLELFAAPGDIGTAEGLDAVMKAINKKGDLDILINNAGVFEPKGFDEIDDDDWREIFEVNVIGGVRLCRRALPGMMKRGWGRIVFVSSESAINVPKDMIHYGVTKTAQLALARGLAKHAAQSGVTVNSVLPGPTWTEGVEEFIGKIAKSEGHDVDEVKDNFVEIERPSSLIGRFATVDEVAPLIVFLCSDRASAMTGAAYRADGGIVETPF